MKGDVGSRETHMAFALEMGLAFEDETKSAIGYVSRGDYVAGEYPVLTFDSHEVA